MAAAKGEAVNCFGLFTRSGESWTATSEKSMDANFIVEQLERFSFSLKKITVVVLDNARIHTAKQMIHRIQCWQDRGLFIFYLPKYSPHLNIAETVWRKLKYEWLAPIDYADKEPLRYSVKPALSEFGKSLRINFSDFKYGLT